MSNLLLNLDELKLRYDKKNENKIKTFEEILRNCHTKIKKYNKDFKKQDCLFQPPHFIIGRPVFDYIELVTYLIESLIKNGLRAEWLNDQNAIYISWKPDDINMNEYHQNLYQEHHIEQPQLQLQIQPQQNSHKTSHSLPIYQVHNDIQPQVKQRRKNTEPIRHHVAMLEYKPGVIDFVPVNFKS